MAPFALVVFAEHIVYIAKESVTPGLTYHSEALLGDLQLRPYMKPSATTMDWMHNLLVNGVGNLECHLFLSRARAELGIQYSQVQAFVTSDWQFPRWRATHKVRCPSSALVSERTKGG